MAIWGRCHYILYVVYSICIFPPAPIIRVKSNKDDTSDPIGAAFDSPALAAATSSPSAPPTSQIGTSPARTARRTFSARFSDPRSRRGSRSVRPPRSPRPTRSLHPLSIGSSQRHLMDLGWGLLEEIGKASEHPSNRRQCRTLLSPSYIDRRGNRPNPACARGSHPVQSHAACRSQAPLPPALTDNERPSERTAVRADNDNCERADVRGEADWIERTDGPTELQGLTALLTRPRLSLSSRSSKQLPR